jgi:tripartite-type tricarboxylate transporter receptor subunit TctC
MKLSTGDDSVPVLKMKWRIAAVLLALSAAISVAAADDYPSRPIRVIVPFEPGGAPDVVTRIVAAAVQKPLGQSVIVENRAGANGIVGMQAVATAEPDGYTLLDTPPAFVINPSVKKKLPFDIFRDFAPVANAGISAGYILMIRPGLPVNSVAELVNYAKTHRLLYGSAGIGNTLHLAAALFCEKAGIEMEHVPFKGAAPIITGLLSRTVDLGFVSPSSSTYVTSGQLRALGVTGKQRIAELPDVPSIRDTLPNFDVEGSWEGWLAPAKTPPEIITRLNTAIRSALKEPSFHDAIVKAGYQPTDMSPEEFAAFIHAEAARYAEAIKVAKIEPE